MLVPLIDTVLDRTVVLGYSRPGYLLRRRTWEPLPSMAGRVVVMNGATSALGLAAAEGFASLGASVRLVAPDADSARRARAEVSRRSGSRDVEAGVCDPRSLDSVREFAALVRSTEPRIDVLVNDAGVLRSSRRLSADGIEQTLAVNVLAPFLLTNLLVRALTAGGGGRIVNVSSPGMYAQRLRIDDLQTERHEYRGAAVYARTKRAQVVLTELWARRLAPAGIVVHAMHPGWVRAPGLEAGMPRLARALRPLLRTPEEGADTILWLGSAAEPGRSTGGFWHDRRRRAPHVVRWTHETALERERLWSECVRLTGWRDESASGTAA